MSEPGLTAGWLAAVHGRLFLLLLALLISLLLGGPRRFHRFLGLDRPGAAFRSFLQRWGKKLNRTHRPEATRQFRGLLLTLFTLTFCLIIAALVSELSRPAEWSRTARGTLFDQWFFLVEILLLAAILPLRPLGERAGDIRRALEKGHVEEARAVAAPIARRDDATLDRHAMARVALEAMAEHFADAVVATAFWYVLLGLPGAFAVAVINLLDRMFSHRDEEKAAFGSVPARLDEALQWIPARLAVFFLLLAALLVPGAHPGRGWKSAVHQGERFASPNAGLPIAAFAGILSITLGGPRLIEGKTVLDPWCGTGTARLEPVDIQRGQLAYAVAAFLFVLAVAAGNLA